jgi:hypothetical protein
VTKVYNYVYYRVGNHQDAEDPHHVLSSAH